VAAGAVAVGSAACPQAESTKIMTMAIGNTRDKPRLIIWDNLLRMLFVC
jgi:O-acetyl-ADP-ribose deacetylase (regulator of RNase III)